ncbi:peptidase inhibitor family I36 protein [Streptomyces sp. NPDC048442]|uniref:peptidase inhibitor family I36 protein n=1 Tax=Streptomyces sp. NPDC048442 TaxID=3154823 RepID=UPI0034338FFC
MLSRSARVVATAAAAAAMVFGSTQASAAVAVDGLQQEIDKVLATTEGGVQISRNEIAWNGGEALMSFALPGEARAPVSSPAAQKLQARTAGLPESTKETGSSALAGDNCPTEVFGDDWYCFYQYKSFEGWRLSWNAQHNAAVYFSTYGFNDMTSSWSNKGDLTLLVYSRTRVGEDLSCTNLLWYGDPHSNAASVAADNMADCFRARPY